jgi:hypothetical protein
VGADGNRLGRVGGNEEKKIGERMKFVQRLFMGIGGLAAAAVALTMLSPKAHALVATLVEVANTRSTPVPNQDVDAPGRHAYQSSCTVDGTNQNQTLTCQMPTVPPNTELVIQNLSMVLYNTTPVYPANFSTQVGAALSYTYVLLAEQSGIAYVANQALTQYSDPGSTPICSFQAISSNPNAELSCSITGYTVSLP